MIKLLSKATFVCRNISSNTQLVKLRRFGLEAKTECKEMMIITKDGKEKAINRVQDYFKGFSLMLLPDTMLPRIVDNLPRINSFKELEKLGIKTNQHDLFVGDAFDKACLALAKDNYSEGLTYESVKDKILEWKDAEKVRDKMDEIKTEKLEYFGKLLTSSFGLHHGLIYICDGVPRVSEYSEWFPEEQKKELHALSSTVFCIYGKKCAEIYEVHPLELKHIEYRAEFKKMQEPGTNVTLIKVFPDEMRSQMSQIFNVYMELSKWIK